MNRRALRWASFLLLAGAVILAAHGGWIHAKALLAQVLLERAWQVSDQGRNPQPPWPWADMAPIAKLVFPRQQESYIVLNRDSGEALAFGPGWTPDSAPPASHGVTVISAHRDTQFRLLSRLRKGDPIRVAAAAGQRTYRVVDMHVVDSRHQRLATTTDMDALVLVTCYPFDAIVPGGPLRYVVQTVPVEQHAGAGLAG